MSDDLRDLPKSVDPELVIIRERLEPLRKTNPKPCGRSSAPGPHVKIAGSRERDLVEYVVVGMCFLPRS